MSILKIGRVFDTLDVDVSAASWSGGTVTFGGELQLGAVTAGDRPETAAAVRDRINALVDSTDELVVPVTWSEDSSVDGYYRPLSVRVDYNVGSLNDGYMLWEIQLEPVGHGAVPQTEVVTTLSHVPNGLGASLSVLNTTGALAISACPNAALEAWNGWTAAEGDDRVAESGTVACFDFDPFGGATLPMSLIHRFAVAPANAYVGACSLKGTYAGLADQLCLGSMSPTTSGLTISNGLVRAKLTGGALTVEVYDSGTWQQCGSYWEVTGTSGSAYLAGWAAGTTVNVLRNSPECVSVRLVAATSSTATPLGRMTLDITVTRGSRMISFLVSADKTATWTVKSGALLAATTITGGVRQTSNDANGNRLVVVGTGNTQDTARCGVGNSVAATSMGFGIGVELGGSAAVNNDAHQKVAYEYFLGKSETQRVVRR